MEGCKILGKWLEELPDGTYPNSNVAIEILHCISSLQIEEEDLDDC